MTAARRISRHRRRCRDERPWQAADRQPGQPSHPHRGLCPVLHKGRSRLHPFQRQNCHETYSPGARGSSRWPPLCTASRPCRGCFPSKAVTGANLSREFDIASPQSYIAGAASWSALTTLGAAYRSPLRVPRDFAGWRGRFRPCTSARLQELPHPGAGRPVSLGVLERARTPAKTNRHRGQIPDPDKEKV